MTTTEQAVLAAEIEGAVRATAGVSAVYRSASVISHLLRAGAAALGVRPEDEPLVSVAETEVGVAVEASIGVESHTRSGDTLRAVRAAVDAVLERQGVRRESLTLTVVHVHAAAPEPVV
ncbi:hypothetical protein [Microbacterium algeriense]|uniref:Asp23/Gls24 family envelope stress response protein n=1 Tax=Microbacterium algeriense TaxID=2615184 RepID=A0ABQ6V2H2_9MICO|nr:hypothetical protein [Microbacterium algeriense]KAB1862253.1 hypothetical protein F6A08_14550 [Microbacterium algeriense]